VTSFEKLIEIPCLVLLGEPRMGKTHEMIAAKFATQALFDENVSRLSGLISANIKVKIR